MFGRNLVLFTAVLFASLSINAADLDHAISGDNEVEDTLSNSDVSGNSPYLVEGEKIESVENSRPKGEDAIFNPSTKEVSGKSDKKYQDFGYTMPGTFEKQENYIDVDKLKMAKDFRKASTGGINISFIKNDFDYNSKGDIINRTVSSGAKSVKGGALYIRNDSYLFKTDFISAHWSGGAGVGFNSGRGFFIDGTRSDTVFKLWEFPVDLGVGLEFQGQVVLVHWFFYKTDQIFSVEKMEKENSNIVQAISPMLNLK